MIGYTFLVMLIYLFGIFSNTPNYVPLKQTLNSISLIIYLAGSILIISRSSNKADLLLLKAINSKLRRRQLAQYSDLLHNKIFESVFKNSTFGVVLTDSAGDIIIANQFFKELLMYPDEEIIDMNFTQITFDEDVSKDLNLFNSLQRDEITQYEIDKRYVKKNGETCWVNLTVTKASENDYMIIVRDISSQMDIHMQLAEQETALKKSDEELRTANDILLKSQENVRLGNWEIDLISNMIILSKPVLEIYGLPENTVLPIYAGINYYRKDFRPLVEQAFSELILNEKKYDLEAVILTESGEEKWVRVIGYPIKKGERIVAVRGLMMDIDGKKKAQIRLEQQSREALTYNRKMLLAQSVLGFGIWSYDVEKDLMDIDDGIYTLLALDKSSHDIKAWKNCVEIKDRKFLYKRIDALKKRAGKFDLLMNVVTHSGKNRKIKNKVESFANKDGNVYLIIGTCTDITEEEQMVSALKKSEQTINDAQEIAGFGYFNYDIASDHLDWSNHMNVIFEPESSFTFNFKSFLGLIHPEDRDRSAQTISRSMQTGEPISLTHRIITRSGSVKTVHHEAKAFINEEKQPEKIVGSTRDITVQSQLQEQLEENLYHQQLLTRIAILLNNPFDFKTKIRKAMEIVGNALGLDGIFIFESATENETFNFEWVKHTCDSYEDNTLAFKKQLVQNEIISGAATNKLLIIDKIALKNPEFEKLLQLRQVQLLCISKFLYAEGTEIIFGVEKIEKNTPFNDSEINLIETAALIIRNIFEANASSIKLQNSEYKFKTLANSISDPYIVLNHDYEFIYTNPAANRFLPQHVDVIGQNLADHQVGPVTKDLIENFQNLKTEKGQQLIQEFDEQYLELSIYKGKIGYSIIVKDITERVNLQNSLELSRKSYQNLYNQTPAMMHSIDQNGYIISVSEFWLEKMGYTQEEVIHKKSVEFLTEEARLNTAANFRELKRFGYLKNKTLQFRKKSGEVMDVLLSATTEKDKDGNFIRSLAVITDVTAEKAAEEQIKVMNQNLDSTVKARTKELQALSNELSRQRDLLNTFIQNTDSIIQIKDTAGNYLLVNKKFAQLHRISNTDELIGKPFSTVYDKQVADRIGKIHQEVLAEGKLVRLQEEININQTRLTFLTTRFPLRKKNGKTYAVAAISVDITKIKEQQEQLKEQSEELRISNKILSFQRNRLKEQQKRLVIANQELESFSYSVSHDLRAPLRALEAFSKLLSDKYSAQLDEKGQKWLSFINDNSLKMDNLINDMLEFSRISRFEIKKQPVNMNALVSSIVEEEKNNYPNHQFDIKIDDLREGYGDPKALKQVWINLIGNAFKYSAKKEVIKVEITSRITVQQTIYEIKDRGAGFNEDYVAKIFNVFQRLHNERDFSGTGVGLAIVKKIIDKHDGAILASGEIDKGATFTFSISRNKLSE